MTNNTQVRVHQSAVNQKEVLSTLSMSSLVKDEQQAEHTISMRCRNGMFIQSILISIDMDGCASLPDACVLFLDHYKSCRYTPSLWGHLGAQNLYIQTATHMVFMLRSVEIVALTVNGSSCIMTSDLASAGIVASIAAASGLLKHPEQQHGTIAYPFVTQPPTFA